MQLTNGLVSAFAIAPLLLPVLALPSPNPNFISDTINSAKDWVDQHVNNNNNNNNNNYNNTAAAGNSSANLATITTQFTTSLNGLLDQKIDHDAAQIIKFVGSTANFLKKIKKEAKKIKNSIPTPSQALRDAEDKIEDAVDDVKKSMRDLGKEVKTDVTELSDAAKQKIREKIAKVACKISNIIGPIKTMVKEEKALNKNNNNNNNNNTTNNNNHQDTNVIDFDIKINIPADLIQKLGLDKCGSMSGNNTMSIGSGKNSTVATSVGIVPTGQPSPIAEEAANPAAGSPVAATLGGVSATSTLTGAAPAVTPVV